MYVCVHTPWFGGECVCYPHSEFSRCHCHYYFIFISNIITYIYIQILPIHGYNVNNLEIIFNIIYDFNCFHFIAFGMVRMYALSHCHIHSRSILPFFHPASHRSIFFLASFCFLFIHAFIRRIDT